VDTSRLPNVAMKVKSLATALLANRPQVVAKVRSARAAAQSYGDNGVRFYRDAASVFAILKSGTPGAVSVAARDAEAAIADAVLWNGRNANSPGSRGLSIEFSAGSVFGPSVAQYSSLAFAKATGWDNWLKVAP